MTTILLLTLFTAAEKEYGLPQNLLTALCYVESNHRVGAVNKDDGSGDSLGVCQVQYRTAKWMGFRGTEKQLMEPRTNVKYAAMYLQYQLRRYGDVTRAVVAYNIGNAKGLQRSNYSDKVNKKWGEINGQRQIPDAFLRAKIRFAAAYVAN